MEANLFDACVIGAGVSGLAAAQTLSRAGYYVVVLEGRDRIGGRVCPTWLGANLLSAEESAEFPSVEVQVGANWIHDLRPSNPIYRIAAQERLGWHETSCGEAFDDNSIIADRAHYESTGETRLMTSAEKGEASSIVDFVEADEDGLRKRLRKRSAKEQHSVSLSDAIDRSLYRYVLKGGPEISTTSQQLLGLHREYRGFSEGFDLERISFTRCVDETTEDAVHGEGIICAGTSHLLPSLAKGLDVRLSHAVKRVRWGACVAPDPAASRITIETADNGSFHASHVICTASLGVLKNGGIAFEPALPRYMADFIDSCEMGLLDIVVIRFRSMFWDPNTILFAACPPTDGPDASDGVRSDLFSHFYNLSLLRHSVDPDFPPVLMCEVAGAKARIVEAMSPADIAAAVVKTLEIIFGYGVVQNPIGCVLHKWGEDPFAYGAYFNYSIGTSPDRLRAMSRPLCACGDGLHARNRKECNQGGACLQLAGEGLNAANIATLQGAYDSGLRAALHVIHRHDHGRGRDGNI